MEFSKLVFIILISMEWLTFAYLNDPIQRYNNIVRPELDTRLYRALILPNKMKVMLITDPTTSKAAASLVVNVGSVQDFKNINGLANLLACALRRRSAKYPEPNSHDHFVQMHDGHTTLQMNDDHQIFAFEIDPDYLLPALDRLAQLFRRPSLADLTNEDLDDAVFMVENDYEKRKRMDIDRIEEVERLLSRPSHEYNHFFHGNKQTLYQSADRATLKKALQTFYEQFYSSNVMYLAVLGKESLNTLDSMVVSLFGRIVNRNVTPCEFKGAQHPWGPEELGRKVYIVPEDKGLQVLRITFPIPDYPPQYEAAMYHFIVNQFLYSGPGGLNAITKKRNLCTRVSVEHKRPAGIGFLRIICVLTDEGVTKVDDVIDLIFQYLVLLSDEGSPYYLLEDMRKMNGPRYHFRSELYRKPMNYVRLVAFAMKCYDAFPMEEVLIASQGQQIIREEDWSQIKMLLCFLKPDYMNVTIVSKLFEGKTDKMEPHYGVPYRIENIEDDKINEWYESGVSSELKFPPPNKFLPDHAKLYPISKNEPEFPYPIHKTSAMQIWFKQDEEFRVPWQHVWIEFRVPRSSWDPCLYVVWNIYWIYHNTVAFERLSTANDAGFELTYKPSEFGINVHIYGHSETMVLFLKEFLSVMKTPLVETVDTELFKTSKSKFLESQALRSADFSDLEYKSIVYGRQFLVEHAWPLETAVDLGKRVQIEDVRMIDGKWFSRVVLQSLIYGNYNRKKAKDVVNLFKNTFPSKRELLPQELLRSRHMQLEIGTHHVYRMFKTGLERYSYITYFQCDTEISTLNEIVFALLMEIILSSCERDLQVYLPDLRCSRFKSYNSLGMMITNKSMASPRVVDSTIKQFLAASLNTVRDLTIGQLTQHKNELRKRVASKNVDLHSSDPYWKSILLQHYKFDEIKEQMIVLRLLKKPQLIAFFKEHFINKRAELTILEFPNGTSSAVTEDLPPGVRKIDDFTAFRSSMTLLPNNRHDTARV